MAFFREQSFRRLQNGTQRSGMGSLFWVKYVKARQKFSHEIEVMDDDCRASEDLGFLSA
jgi:hypothetical protein